MPNAKLLIYLDILESLANANDSHQNGVEHWYRSGLPYVLTRQLKMIF